ncbi:Ribosome biogenesis protein BRX1 homolog [Geodia barretti]|uniref:Ribosome biogenesis protein BRX1 homolog n=1 Tax=Geodia barretti TaxID=519541 RepID=A0AA35SQ54_GEOBA|nr:Ribosome biogenesis protein BRX1 homolog [Geodia barretti]
MGAMDAAHVVDEATGQASATISGETGRKKRKRKRDEVETAETLSRSIANSGEPAPLKKPKKWKNKQRVLVFCARGITYRCRHLVNDLKILMPHSRTDSKLDRKDKLPVINEICEMKNCTKCMFFEMRKKKDIYMWVSNVPDGPSAKFLVENVHTMNELKLTGNCLKGSRPLLSFDPSFGGSPQLELLRELFTQVFSTPYHHPKSKPFVDHTLHFSVLDDRIWFRNYQIVDGGGGLTEIGECYLQSNGSNMKNL